MTKRLLDLSGIGEERLSLAWVSSAEAQRFADVATDIVARVKAAGPLDRTKLGMALKACRMTVDSETLRWLVGKEHRIITGGDVYGRQWTTEKYEEALNTALEREYHKNLIYLAVAEGFTSVREISGRLSLPLKRVSYLLADLEKTGQVEFRGMKEKKPVYAAL